LKPQRLSLKSASGTPDLGAGVAACCEDGVLWDDGADPVDPDDGADPVDPDDVAGGVDVGGGVTAGVAPVTAENRVLERL